MAKTATKKKDKVDKTDEKDRKVDTVSSGELSSSSPSLSSICGLDQDQAPAASEQDDKAPAAPERDHECRRCSECRDSDHHWIDTADGYVCKHCPATKPFDELKETKHKQDVKAPAASERDEKYIYIFPDRGRVCPRCRAADTSAYATKDNIQYRKCNRPICRYRYSVRGTRVKK